MPSIVIFGASGDLTHRKLIPALYDLFSKGRLPKQFRILGYARTEMDDQSFRERMGDGIREFSRLDEDTWRTFSQAIHYVHGEYDNVADMERLFARLAELEEAGAGRLYYLSTPPKLYAPIIHCLGAAGMTAETNGWRRVVIEKPFGHDLASARALNDEVHMVLAEHQVYRIDHYLGKETVQNLLVFRFANTIFEPIWNRNYISNVQITAAETVDVGHRAGYYDGVGIARDMFQNHLLQLMSLVSMEPPASFEANSLRNEKVKLLSAIRPLEPAECAVRTVRGQYKGYRESADVAPNSQTATYAAVKLTVDNWRWQGVPFYLRSGKALKDKTTEIVICFKQPPIKMFPIPQDQPPNSNMLAICVQPDEGIHLRFEAKQPGTTAVMRSVDMDFHYAESFGEMPIPDAYERLLLDALNGDASLFTRADEIELSWRIIDSIITGWQSDVAAPLHIYPTGSWGPPEGDWLLEQDGNDWRSGCAH